MSNRQRDFAPSTSAPNSLHIVGRRGWEITEHDRVEVINTYAHFKCWRAGESIDSGMLPVVEPLL